MLRLKALGTTLVALMLATSACDKLRGNKDKDKDKGDAADGKGEGGEAGKKGGDADEEQGDQTLQVNVGDEGADGPVPPESSMVFFTVEGALLPLACFDKGSKSIRSGGDCLKLVEKGAAVRLASTDTQENRKAGDRAQPQCTRGSGRKSAIAVDGITQGADYKYAAWPPAGLKLVKAVSDETTKPENTQLEDDEKSKLLAGIKSDWSSASGEVSAHQIAEIDVDGDDKKDKVYSVFLPHPKLQEQYTWSGIFLAKGGDLGKLTLLQKSKTKRDVFEVRGTLDLDGDKTNELWLRLVFEEGGGDRLYSVKGGSARAIGKWSCGA